MFNGFQVGMRVGGETAKIRSAVLFTFNPKNKSRDNGGPGANERGAWALNYRLARHYFTSHFNYARRR